MKPNKIIFMLAISIFLAITTSCYDVNSALESYNGKYQQGIYGTEVYSGIGPVEEGFDETKMLAEKYTVSDDATLCLSAPPRCASHLWSIKKVTETTTIGLLGQSVSTTSEEDIKCTLSNGSSMTTKDFTCYIPNSGLDVGSYRIMLTVTDEEGNEYSDKCLLVVYVPLN